MTTPPVLHARGEEDAEDSDAEAGSLSIISPSLRVGGEGTWSWSGGTAPYAMSIRVNEDIVRKADNLSDHNWMWKVEAQEGDVVVFGVTDAKGQRIYSAATTVEAANGSSPNKSATPMTISRPEPSASASSSYVSSTTSGKKSEKEESTITTTERKSSTSTTVHPKSSTTTTVKSSSAAKASPSSLPTSGNIEGGSTSSISPAIPSSSSVPSSSLLDSLSDDAQSKTPLYVGVGGLIAAVLLAVVLAYWWRSRGSSDNGEGESHHRRKRRRHGRSLPKSDPNARRKERDRGEWVAESSECYSELEEDSEEERLLSRK